MDTITPEEFRTLKIQVDILQRFLTKTFGSSFLDFCKDAQKSLSKGNTSPPLSNNSKSAGNGPLIGVESDGGTKGGTKSPTKAGFRRPPPPLLHRPNPIISQKLAKVTNLQVETLPETNGEELEDSVEQEYYDVSNIEEDLELLQPETVFSDDETNISTKAPNRFRRDASQPQRNKPGVKRGHTVAFNYEEEDETEDNINGSNINLPVGTDCIALESDDEQGQEENYEYQQDVEGYDDGTNGDMFEDSLGYEDGIEDNGNLLTEDVTTESNITYGTLVTSPESGLQYFQCSFCPSQKIFKHKQSLKEHYLLNHSPTPPAFQCHCGRRFLKQSQLKRHEVVHTAERPYVCPICLKDFTRKDNMTVHMVRNHAEKKHPCPYCPGKIYATLAEVNRHLRLYHSQWQQQQS